MASEVSGLRMTALQIGGWCDVSQAAGSPSPRPLAPSHNSARIIYTSMLG